MCSAKFDFISGYVSAFICSMYHVLKATSLTDIELGKSLHLSLCTPVDVYFFLLGGLCGYVYVVSMEYVLCSMLCLSFYKKFLAIFSLDNRHTFSIYRKPTTIVTVICNTSNHPTLPNMLHSIP